MNYNTADLSKLKYVKVIYTGLDSNLHEVKTEVKFIGNELIALYFRDYNRGFNINYPQKVTVKFVCEDGLYSAQSVLQKIEKVDDIVYFTILPPGKMDKRQNRKYYRINLKRTCVLITTKKDGTSSAYMSRLVDVSAGGVLIHRLESMFNDKYVSIEPKDYDYFNIVLFLDLDIVLKLSARYIRHEKAEDSDRYAFEFTRMKPADTDTISKYVTKEQVEQLKMQNKTNNQTVVK